MARPRKAAKDRRSEIVRFAVRPDELVRIHKAAARSGRTASAYARAMALSGRVVIHQTRALPPEIFDQLRRIGVNLNQLARLANRKGDLPPGLGRLCATIELFIVQHISHGPKSPP